MRASGMCSIVIVGLPDPAVKGPWDRLMTALINFGFCEKATAHSASERRRMLFVPRREPPLLVAQPGPKPAQCHPSTQTAALQCGRHGSQRTR